MAEDQSDADLRRRGARQVARRVRALIARHDGGDVTRAASRLGLTVTDLFRLESRLAHDAPERLRVLAAVVRSYDVDACWLLTGKPASELSALAPAVRLEVADVLLAIGDQLLARYRTPGQGGDATPRA